MNPASIPLAEQLAALLSDYVTAKFLTHGYHWNVKGKDFKEFHAFFEEIYSDYDSAIDPVAENLRKLGYEAPYLLSDFSANTSIDEARIVGGDVDTMVNSLVRINQALLDNCFTSFALATDINEQGIANFLAERIDQHQFWNWQLTSSQKVEAIEVALDNAQVTPEDDSQEM